MRRKTNLHLSLSRQGRRSNDKQACLGYKPTDVHLLCLLRQDQITGCLFSAAISQALLPVVYKSSVIFILVTNDCLFSFRTTALLLSEALVAQRQMNSSLNLQKSLCHEFKPATVAWLGKAT
ncbi:hypothetical protein PoB_001360500 [Plakobranchus ocellatus]|uniref:Uncharacterized protein n=1 Tax=Plakobranchus ocellatus TaxID=259542 RepID=A0AAV3YXA3_9GAST|nr:hypothetical protein PoB_001360500 [Plakobranchus ocellatus]